MEGIQISEFQKNTFSIIHINWAEIRLLPWVLSALVLPVKAWRRIWFPFHGHRVPLRVLPWMAP